MKKIITVLIVSLLAVTIGLICGCSKEDDSWKTNENYDLSVPVLTAVP